MQDKIIYGIQRTIFVFFMILIISCVPVSKLKYFNDIDELKEPIVNPREQKLIKPFDKIDISVLSIDEKTNQLFKSGATASVSTSGITGYLVDVDGNINYPFTGKINIKDLSPEQASAKIVQALSEYGFNTTVRIDFIERNVTILGEVQRQGVFSFSQDKLNIYEALALGGGISRLGNREKVILIRQDGERIMHHKLNLSDSKIAGKEYYYIQANDVIVVEPMKSSSWYNFNSLNFTTIISSISSFITVYYLIKFNNIR